MGSSTPAQLSRSRLYHPLHTNLQCNIYVLDKTWCNLSLPLSPSGTAEFPEGRCVASGVRTPLDYTKSQRTDGEIPPQVGERMERGLSQKKNSILAYPLSRHHLIRTDTSHSSQLPTLCCLEFKAYSVSRSFFRQVGPTGVSTATLHDPIRLNSCNNLGHYMNKSAINTLLQVTDITSALDSTPVGIYRQQRML